MFFIDTLKRLLRRLRPARNDDAPAAATRGVGAGGAPRRRALLIGNNYPGSSCPLSGCVNDVNDVRDFLTARTGWDVEVKTEATKLEIVQSLSKLALQSWTQGLDAVYIHYSGHGTQVRDAEGEEADGLDEALCPADYETAGMVTDDFLNFIICGGFNPRTKVRAVFDACHSGSCLDLPYTCAGGKAAATRDRRARRPRGDVQLLSGCRDAQTSADSSYGGRAAGALTNSMLRVLRASPNATSRQVLDGVHALLAAEAAEQFPLLSSALDPAAGATDAFLP